MMRTLLFRLHILFGFLIILTFASCRKEFDRIQTEEESYVRLVSCDVSGRVETVAHHAVSNAEIKMGSLTTTTDENGVFLFSNIAANSLGQLVEVKAQGYDSKRVWFLPEEGESHVLHIQVESRSNTFFVNGDQGGAIQLGQKIELFIPDEAFLDPRDQIETGRVMVHWELFKQLSHNQNNFSTLSPLGRDQGNNLHFILSQMEARLWFTNLQGERLTLSSSVKLTLSRDQLFEDVSALILWQQDDISDDFREVSEVLPEVQVWTVDLQQPGYLKIGAPSPFERRSVGINHSGVPVSWTSTVLSSVDYGVYQIPASTSNGSVRFPVPQLGEWTLSALNLCDEMFLVGDVPIHEGVGEFDSGQTLFLTAQLNDCQGSPLKDGYFLMHHPEGTQIIPILREGKFREHILICDPESISYSFVNKKDIQRTERKQLPSTSKNVELGNVTVCDVSGSDYIRYFVDGVQGWIDVPTGGYDFGGDSILIVGDDPMANNPRNFQDVILVIDPDNLGTQPVDHIELYVEDNGNGTNVSCNGNCDNRVWVTLKENGKSVGDKIIGTWEGEVRDFDSGEFKSVRGEFMVTRSY